MEQKKKKIISNIIIAFRYINVESLYAKNYVICVMLSPYV